MEYVSKTIYCNGKHGFRVYYDSVANKIVDDVLAGKSVSDAIAEQTKPVFTTDPYVKQQCENMAEDLAKEPNVRSVRLACGNSYVICRKDGNMFCANLATAIGRTAARKFVNL